MTVPMRYLLVLLAVTAGVLVSSCGSDDPPAPTVPPTVARVLDLSPYEKKPCSLLTAEQLVALGLTLEEDELPSVICGGLSRPSNPHEVIYLRTYVRPEDDPNRSAESAATYSTWTTIAGQPAITSSSRHGCWAMMWTAPKQAVVIDIFSNKGMEERDDWCDRARAVLEPIVANLVG